MNEMRTVEQDAVQIDAAAVTDLEVLLAEGFVRVDRLRLGQLLDGRCTHSLHTTGSML